MRFQLVIPILVGAGVLSFWLYKKKLRKERPYLRDTKRPIKKSPNFKGDIVSQASWESFPASDAPGF